MKYTTKKPKIISVVNNKGGVGKTTLSVNLSAALAKKGLKVGLVDLDGQSQVKLAFKYNQRNDLRSVLSRPVRSIHFRDFSPTDVPGLAILPNEGNITDKFFHNLSTIKDEETLHLSRAMKTISAPNERGEEGFDVIIIDCNPSLDVQAINGLVASDYVIVPTMLDFMKIDGTYKFLLKYQSIRDSLNQNIKLLGVAILDYKKPIWRHLSDTEESVVDKLGKHVFTTRIRTNNKFDRVNIERANIFTTKIKDRGIKKGQDDFLELADEVINRMETVDLL